MQRGPLLGVHATQLWSTHRPNHSELHTRHRRTRGQRPRDAMLDRVVKPNVALLRECGLGSCDIAKVCLPQARLITTSPERVRAMVACAEGLAVARGSGMFRGTLLAVAFRSEEKIAAKVEYLKKTFGWSDAEVGIVLSRAPQVLTKSEDMLQRRSKFLIAEVGLEPAYIAHRPVMLCLSLEGRLRHVVKFLKENGLLRRDRNYNTAVQATEKVFMENIRPHNLAQDYAAACRGEARNRLGRCVVLLV